MPEYPPYSPNQYVKDHLQFVCGLSAAAPPFRSAMLRQASYIGDGTLLHEQKQKKENILYDRCPFPSLSACAQGG